MKRSYAAAAPTFTRHLSSRLSSLPIASIQNMPVVAKIKIPTKTLSVWKVAPAAVIIKPIPAVATFQTDKVFVGILIFATTGMFCIEVIGKLERRFDKWRVKVGAAAA